MNELKLKDNNPDKYIVCKLSDGTYFIHDKESEENFFNQESIEKLCGLSQRMVSYHLSQYEAFGSNIQNMYIALNTVNSTKPVYFYSFDALTYVAFRSNKPEAVVTRNYINKQLNRMFNYDVGFSKHVKSLEQEAKETISYLESKVWEHTKNAFESNTKEDFNYYMDLADKYSMDSMKRRFQLRNEINCNKRLRHELEMNRKGLLTESGENRVFIPDNQSTLIEFNLNINIK